MQQVLVENDRAVGIRLADGAEQRADTVISAADGYSTIYGMLGGRYKNEAIERYYAAVPDAQDMTIHVSLGVARDLTHEPHAIVYMLPEPVTLTGEARDRLDLELYSFDPSLAPAGKSVIKVMLRSRYAYWKALASDHGAYEAEKQTIAETVIAQLERRFPGLSAQVEVADVATPLTTER